MSYSAISHLQANCPITWPRSTDQLPFNFDQMATGDNVPLFPFGYGLH